MNIDERLERIGERLDAMAMNLELFEQHFLDMIKKLAETQAESAQAIHNLVDVARMNNNSMQLLAKMVDRHEWRLNNLEGGKKD